MSSPPAVAVGTLAAVVAVTACKTDKHSAARSPSHATSAAAQPGVPSPSASPAPAAAAAEPEHPLAKSRVEMTADEDDPAARPPCDAPRTRILELDGGSLEIVRSEDGRTAWTLRHYDDGSTSTRRFLLELAGRPLPDGVVLAPVDGVPPGGPEAWLVDAENATAYSPQRDKAYPIIHAGNHEPPMPTWRTFHARCPEADGPCVYTGAPESVCGSYFAAEDVAPPAGRQPGDLLWIAPESCTGQW